MIGAAVNALMQILSPPMRAILWRAIGLALVLIVVASIGLQRLLSWLAGSGELWVETMLGPAFHTPLNILAWVLSIAAGLGIVFGAVGAARDCLETTLDYVGTRMVFDKALAGYQITQAKIADMAVELGKAQLLALHLGRLKDDGRIRPEQVSVGKLNNVREAIKIARQCLTLLGANGITLEYPVIRHANNLESVLTYEGTSEVHQLVIGQALTGENAFS